MPVQGEDGGACQQLGREQGAWRILLFGSFPPLQPDFPVSGLSRFSEPDPHVPAQFLPPVGPQVRVLVGGDQGADPQLVRIVIPPLLSRDP